MRLAIASTFAFVLFFGAHASGQGRPDDRAGIFLDRVEHPVSLDELWAPASVVVVGDVVSTAVRVLGASNLPRRNESLSPPVQIDSLPPRVQIWTDHTIVTRELLKDDGRPSGPQLRLTLQKGTANVGGRVYEVIDDAIPDIAVGDRLVLFLRWNAAEEGYAIVAATGLLKVENDTIVLSDWSRARLTDANGRARVPADEMLNRLRQLADRDRVVAGADSR